MAWVLLAKVHVPTSCVGEDWAPLVCPSPRYPLALLPHTKSRLPVEAFGIVTVPRQLVPLFVVRKVRTSVPMTESVGVTELGHVVLPIQVWVNLPPLVRIRVKEVLVLVLLGTFVTDQVTAAVAVAVNTEATERSMVVAPETLPRALTVCTQSLRTALSRRALPKSRRVGGGLMGVKI